MTCAGINTELRPFTDMMPKCLLPINGKSILHHNLDWLQKHDVDEVTISTSYYSNQIELALKKYQSKQMTILKKLINIRILTIYFLIINLILMSYQVEIQNLLIGIFLKNKELIYPGLFLEE